MLLSPFVHVLEEDQLAGEAVGLVCSMGMKGRGTYGTLHSERLGYKRFRMLSPLAPSESLALTSFTLHRLSLQLKDPEKSHPLRWPKSKEELLLQSKSIQLMSLLSNNQCCNTFGNLLLGDITPCILLPSTCMKY